MIKRFMAKVLLLPKIWIVWILWLVVVNLVMPLFFIGSREAQLTLTGMIIVFCTGSILFKTRGYTRILGLSHWIWFPLIYLLWPALQSTQPDNFYGVWLRCVVLSNGFSLLLDMIDVLTYFAGNKQELV